MSRSMRGVRTLFPSVNGAVNESKNEVVAEVVHYFTEEKLSAEQVEAMKDTPAALLAQQPQRVLLQKLKNFFARNNSLVGNDIFAAEADLVKFLKYINATWDKEKKGVHFVAAYIGNILRPQASSQSQRFGQSA